MTRDSLTSLPRDVLDRIDPSSLEIGILYPELGLQESVRDAEIAAAWLAPEAAAGASPAAR